MALGKHFPRIRLGIGLVAWYRLDGFYTTGKVFDYSRNGHAGTVVGTSCLPKYPGFNFDGTQDYVDTGDSFESTFQDSFSISAWAKPDDGQTASAQKIFSIGDDTFDHSVTLYILEFGGKLVLYYESNGNSIQAKSNAANFANGPETWHHIVAVADSTIGGIGGLKLYFDGNEVALSSSAGYDGDTSGITFADFACLNNVFLGAYYSYSLGAFIEGFKGDIGNVMIYKKALTAVEVKGLYRQTKRFYVKE